MQPKKKKPCNGRPYRFLTDPLTRGVLFRQDIAQALLSSHANFLSKDIPKIKSRLLRNVVAIPDTFRKSEGISSDEPSNSEPSRWRGSGRTTVSGLQGLFGCDTTVQRYRAQSVQKWETLNLLRVTHVLPKTRAIPTAMTPPLM